MAKPPERALVGLVVEEQRRGKLGESVLRIVHDCVGRHTHRMAKSNHRVVDIEDDQAASYYTFEER